MNYYIIASIVISVIILCFLYWFKYYYDLNLLIKGKKKKMINITPLKFSTILIIAMFLFIGSFAMIKVYALENENVDLKKELEYERFDDGNFPNQYFRLVYEEYNIFFSGYYLDENNQYILCITENASSEIIEILSNANIQFSQVKYSYAQLKEVYKILSFNIIDYNFLSVSLSFKSNKVEVTIKDESVDLSSIQVYIDEGIVAVEIGDEFIAY